MRGGIVILGNEGTPGLDLGVFTPSFRIASSGGGGVPGDVPSKVSYVVTRVRAYLSDEWRLLVDQLRTPRTIALIVGEIFGGGAETFVPSMASAAGVVAQSTTLQQVAPDVSRLVTLMWKADSWHELEEAVRILARVIVRVGPQAAFCILTMGKCPSISPVSRAMGTSEAGGGAIGEDVVRSYMSTGGNSQGDAKQRFSKGMKSQVTRNVRTTLEFMAETDAADPIVEEGPNALVQRVLEDMNLEDSVMPERLKADTLLIATAESGMGGWFVHKDSGVGTHVQAQGYKVKGTVVALKAAGARREQGRRLFIPRTMYSQLLRLPPEAPPAPVQEIVPVGSVIVEIEQKQFGGLFMYQNSGVGFHAKARAFRVKGRVPASVERPSVGDPKRLLYIPSGAYRNLQQLPPEEP
ncbi:MAG: hypothetical protein SFY69_08515 [Planctomycetota bacterium]|nr:hypothetical protein [Planctomycetota bacterium]